MVQRRFTRLRPVSPRYVVLNEPETIMAIPSTLVTLGCDVSQQWLDINVYGEDQVTHINNARSEIDAFLKGYAGAVIAVEATNTYHELIVERALKLGLTVYLVGGYQLKHYAEAIDERMRTDRVDAKLLARFLHRERDRLKPFEPKSPDVKRLWTLMKRRALLVKTKGQIRQSFAGLAEFKSSAKTTVKQIDHVITLIERRIRELVKNLDWQADVLRVKAIFGIGPLTAIALVCAYRSYDFPHRDPYIAFMGLDVRTKDSGKHRGKRKLSKKGDGEFRRLLFNTAMAAKKSYPYFEQRYNGYVSRGLSTTGALMAIGRQQARIAFALLKNQVDFDPNRFNKACNAT